MHNNPTCVAIHECKLLWPDEPIQSVISLGNGRYEPNIELMSSLPSAKKQIDNIIDSATNTESKPLFLVWKRHCKSVLHVKILKMLPWYFDRSEIC